MNIECLVCGNIFLQTVDTHINAKSGCPKCSLKKRADARRSSEEDFKQKANKVHHPESFDYSKVAYINS